MPQSKELLHPRILWDMTFAAKSLTGTRIYAQKMFDALSTLDTVSVNQVSALSNMPPEKTGHLFTGIQNVWWQQIQLPRLAQIQHADLIHASAYLGPLHPPCPLIVNVLDTTFLEFPADFDWKWRMYARFLIPPTIRRAAALITLSEYSRRAIARAYSISSQRIRVVYPGISSEFHPTTDADTILEVRERYQLPTDYILFVGAQEPRKNIPAVIAALAQCRAVFPTLALVLVGPRSSDSAAIQRTVSEFGLNHAVHDLGFVPQNDLPAIYSAARALVYASRLEGFGMPPLEAMACGVPVIAVPNPPLPEVLDDAALWTDNDNPNALAAAVVRVLSDAKLSEKLRQRGMNHARKFSWERAAQETLGLYREVLAKL